MILAESTKSITSEELWAQHGLTGLVIFALICVILVMVRTILVILREERQERQHTTEQHVKATDKLSQSIDGLTKAFSKHGD